MIVEFGIASTIVGSVLALYARRHRSVILEACAGALLIIGLACVGAGLPHALTLVALAPELQLNAHCRPICDDNNVPNAICTIGPDYLPLQQGAGE
ncbi:hypothetical protein ACQPTN_25470 [Bradyrhizobium sp. 13971]